MTQFAALLRPPSGRDPTRRQTKLFLRLTSASLTRTAITLVIACVVVQIALGADLVVLGITMVGCVAGLAAFRLAGAYNAAGWLSFFFALGNAMVAVTAKTIFFQPLDSHLYAPLESFSALAVGSAALLIATCIALTIPVGRPVFRSLKDPRLLGWLSNWTFSLGALFWYLNRLFQDPEGSGFGGLTVFWNLVLMAVIARTAMLLERSNGRCSVDAQLLLVLVACVAMGLIDNSKTSVALPIVAYFATSLFYRGGLTLRQAAAGAFGFVLMAALIGPMIHAYRALGIQRVPWEQRVKLIESGLRDAYVNGHLERYERLASGEFLGEHYNYFGDDRGQMLVGRYASIQQIDPIIANVGRRGALGGTVILGSFARVLPSFLYPDKPRYIEGYGVLVHLGLIDPEGGKYPVVPLLAQSYAGYGPGGLLLIPFLTFLGLLLALKKLGWRLYRNVFAIFFFCVFVVVYANQGDLGQYAEAVLRNFPLLAAILWLLVRIHRVRISYRPAVTPLRE